MVLKSIRSGTINLMRYVVTKNYRSFIKNTFFCQVGQPHPLWMSVFYEWMKEGLNDIKYESMMLFRWKNLLFHELNVVWTNRGNRHDLLLRCEDASKRSILFLDIYFCAKWEKKSLYSSSYKYYITNMFFFTILHGICVEQ